MIFQERPPNLTALLIPIPDPEMIWLADQEEIACQQQLERQQKQQEEEEVTIVMDTVEDQSLQAKEDDYIPFPTFPMVDSDDDDDSSLLGSDR